MARNRLLRIAATAAVMLVAVVALDARPAAAAATGDWSHNNQLCYGNCTRTGNPVRLWQSILWSESYAADVSFIYGHFRPKNRSFMLRQTRTARVWSFETPRTGAWTGT